MAEIENNSVPDGQLNEVPRDLSNPLIDEIIRKEGSKYTDRKNDKGGPTKFGITIKTLGSFRGKAVTAKDVENLEEMEARQIYKTVFIDKSSFRNIIPLIRDMLIDWAVTSGEDDPTKAVQVLLNKFGADILEDGVFGRKTEKALVAFIKEWGENFVYNKLIDARVLFYCGIVTRDSTQSENCLGWVRRALSFRKY